MRVRLTINGRDATHLFYQDDWSLTKVGPPSIDMLNLRLNFERITPTSNNIHPDADTLPYPKLGYEVILEDADDPSNRFFGGLVVEVSSSSYGLGAMLQITCQDWKILLDRAIVTQNYINKDDNVIIESVMELSELEGQIDYQSFVELGKRVEAISFNGTTVRHAMESLVRISNYIWDVDPFKRLIYRPIGRVLSPNQLSDNPNGTTSFPFYEEQYTEELGVYNSVEVVGSGVLSENIIDIYETTATRLNRRLYYVGQPDGTSPLSSPPLEDPQPASIVVEENTGTDAVPVWSGLDIGYENQDMLSRVDALWSPITGRLEFADERVVLASSFRVRGRYFGPIRVEYQDAAEVRRNQGRVFKKLLVEPAISSREEAVNVAQTFLEEAGTKLRVMVKTQQDGFDVDQSLMIKAEKFGLNRILGIIEMRMNCHGAEVYEYQLVLGDGRNSLTNMLVELKRKAGRNSPPIIASLTKNQTTTSGIAIASVQYVLVARGPTYYVTPSGLDEDDIDFESAVWNTRGVIGYSVAS